MADQLIRVNSENYVMASDVLGVRFAGGRNVTVATSTGCYSLDVDRDKTGIESITASSARLIKPSAITINRLLKAN